MPSIYDEYVDKASWLESIHENIRECKDCIHSDKVFGLDQPVGCKLFGYHFSQSSPQPVRCNFFERR